MAVARGRRRGVWGGRGERGRGLGLRGRSRGNGSQLCEVGGAISGGGRGGGGGEAGAVVMAGPGDRRSTSGHSPRRPPGGKRIPKKRTGHPHRAGYTESVGCESISPTRIAAWSRGSSPGS